MSVLLALLGGGCGAAPYNIHFALDPQFSSGLGDERVFVHVIPLTSSNWQDLATLSPDIYWQYGAAASAAPVPRPPGTRMFELSADTPRAVLNKDDPAWSQWKQQHVEELLVLSSRPQPMDNTRHEPRRRILPAGQSGWGKHDLDLVIGSQGLEVALDVLAPDSAQSRISGAADPNTSPRQIARLCE